MMSTDSARNIVVRPAAITDADQLVTGNLAMAWETESRRLDPAIVALGVRAALTDPAYGRYFVAELAGNPAGQAMVTREWSDWRNGWFWWFQSVYVHPQFRRQGVFRSLHQAIRSLARNTRDVCGLRLYVEHGNAAALRTYAALGMPVCGYRLCEEDWSGGR